MTVEALQNKHQICFPSGFRVGNAVSGEAGEAKGALAPLLMPPKKDLEPVTVIDYIYRHGRSSVLSEESVLERMQSISFQVEPTFTCFGGIAGTITSPYRSTGTGLSDRTANRDEELFQFVEEHDEPLFVEDCYFDVMSNLLERDATDRLDLSACVSDLSDLYAVRLEEG